MIGDLAWGLMAQHELAAILQCPKCGGDLAQQDFRCKREGCGPSFRSLLGGGDLRLVEAPCQGRLSQETVIRLSPGRGALTVVAPVFRIVAGKEAASH